MKVNISNELNFSDVLYRSINYTGSLIKFWGSFTLHATQCSLYFVKHRKSEIYSLNITFISKMRKKNRKTAMNKGPNFL